MNSLKELIRQSIKEIDFKDQEAFKKYKAKHKMKPDTSVNIDGKDTTVGDASGEKTSKEEPKGDEKKQVYANLDYDKAEDDLDDLRYSGTVEDNPSLTYNIGDMIKSMESGNASPEDIARAEEISDTLDTISQTNDEDPESFEKLSMALDVAVKGTKKEESITSNPIKESKGIRTTVKEVKK